MARLVLTDASPIIGLSRVHGVHWLRALFGQIEMTAEVSAELRAGTDGAALLEQAKQEGWLQVRSSASTVSKEPTPSQLGPGEWSTIQVAVSHDGPCLVLLDDRLARREAARFGLRVAGTAAIIGMAERRGVIPSARDVFERLLRTDFRVAPVVIRQVLSSLEE
jgi:predicted nucleic acid-binding protein